MLLNMKPPPKKRIKKARNKFMEGFKYYITLHSHKLFPDITKPKRKRKHYKSNSFNFRTMSFGFPMNISDNYYSSFKKQKTKKKKTKKKSKKK